MYSDDAEMWEAINRADVRELARQLRVRAEYALIPEYDGTIPILKEDDATIQEAASRQREAKTGT